MFEFKLPDVGEGVAEGEVVAWHVEVGDEVEEDQVVAEVETDKAVVDVPIPVAGTVQERHAEVGEVLPVGETLITIDTGEGDAAIDVEAEAGAEVGPDTGAAADTAGADEGAPTEGAAPAGAEDGQEPVTAAPEGRVFAPPHVRRLARELGVDIAAVDGSGPGGRVNEADVRAAAEAATADEGGTGSHEGSGAAAAGEPDEAASGSAGSTGPTGGEAGGAGGAGAASGAGAAGGTAGSGGSQVAAEAADRDRTLAVPATRALADDLGVDLDAVPTDRERDGEAYVTPEEVRAFAEAGGEAAAAGEVGTGAAGAGTAGAAERPAGGVTTESYTGIRRTIGQKMAESKYTAPHVTHHDSVEVSALVESRAAMKERAAERGVKLTYMPFVLKAVVAGLQEFPILNSELDEDAEEIKIKHDYNIGVATATEAGLMVPVVEHVDQKGILQLASEVNELTQKARERSIAREEMQGGTFTITNFGAVGGEYATPIINYPETAILGLGGIDERPWVEDGEVVARPVLPLSLTIDHRVIDGAEAAQFTNRVMEYLANPAMLLLE